MDEKHYRLRRRLLEVRAAVGHQAALLELVRRHLPDTLPGEPALRRTLEAHLVRIEEAELGAASASLSAAAALLDPRATGPA